MAGVGGSLLYLLYVGVLDLDFRSTFLYTIPWMGLYLLAYHALVGPSTTDATRVALAKPLLGGTRDREGFCARVLRCTRYCGWVTLNLCLVYVEPPPPPHPCCSMPSMPCVALSCRSTQVESR